ncbi:Outer membrane stress sensor protease DegS [hydrothermal vent metagenome]|uniref:Outer membrane stress sensor protease DegS n=1 Tax=hydrothermal vent metagenome TaxID=652676 RepID=A0A3B0YH94_9ZZZZ
MNASHSTRFIFSWALIGLLIGGGIIAFSILDFNHLFSTNNLNSNNKFSYADAVNKAAVSVVNINAFHLVKEPPKLLPENPNKENKPTFKIRPNKGSGVIISTNGYIVTNNHVVSGAQRIEVMLHDGRRVDAQIIGQDPGTDLAVIAVPLKNLPAISFSDSDKTRVGDIVLAIGNPFGIGQTVTQGIISATGRDRVGLNTYENFIQTDAAINRGNSGGALINPQGEILAINSAIYSKTGNYLGISFAIPINLVTDVVKQIINHGEVIRGWLGVEGVDLNEKVLEKVDLPNIQGVLITDVFDRGPADMAGVRVGDILTHINKKIIRDTRDVLNAIANGRPGDQILISGIRDRQSFVTQATLEKRPKE